MFPDTPKTLLDRLRQEHRPQAWERSWEEFFDLYHHAVRLCVAGQFRRHGWHSAGEHEIQDVVMSVFTSILRGHEGYDRERGRLRQWLSGVCAHRVADFIRRHARNHPSGVHADAADGGESTENRSAIAAAMEAARSEEESAFHTALIGILLSALRAEVAPRVFLIFELVKLAGHNPADVATELGVKRGVIDNSIHKAMRKLREIAERQEIQKEFNP